jgi:phage shock protein PspC (stress-responsive transcriptional regulator)
MEKEKELYRIKEGKWLAGVCTGMAEYMNLSVTVVRCIMVAMGLFFCGGVLVYIASIFMIPWKPEALAQEEAAEAEESGDAQ